MAFWVLLITLIVLIAFHQQTAALFHCAIVLLREWMQPCQVVLMQVWTASRHWLQSEPLASPLRVFVGCVVFGLAILAAYNNFGILQDLLPQVFPFGGAGNAVLLALANFFMGLLLHQIEQRWARRILGLLAVALVALNGFLAYCGAAANENADVLLRGGLAVEWPLNRDIGVVTGMALIYSASELIGSWGALHLAGGFIARLVFAPFAGVVGLALLGARFFSRDGVQKGLHYFVTAIEIILGRLAAAASYVAHFFWRNCQPAIWHARFMAWQARKKERAASRYEYASQQLKLDQQLREAKAEAKFQARMKALQRKTLWQTSKRVLRVFKASLIQAARLPATQTAAQAARVSPTAPPHQASQFKRAAASISGD